MSHYLTLTQTDKAILESYKTALDGLSLYLGKGYELILHSLEDLEHSVIKIINGHYTGREEGSPITDLALSMLDHIKEKGEPKALSYFNRRSGKTLKSVTIPILGEQKRLIGLLCINFHMDLSLSDALAAWIPGIREEAGMMEHFSPNAEELMAKTVEEAKAQVYGDPTVSAANKNKEIVRLLYEKGLFNMKDAAFQAASMLGISKNTVYLHLRNLEKKRDG